MSKENEMKKYVFTEKEIRDNLAMYNEDMLCEIGNDLLLDFVKDQLLSGKSITMADLDEAFSGQVCIIDPSIDTIQLVKEFPCLVLDRELLEDLENEIDFVVVILLGNGKYKVINSSEIDF